MAQSARGMQGERTVNFANASIPLHQCFPCKHPLWGKKKTKNQNYQAILFIKTKDNAKSDEGKGFKKQEAIGERFQKMIQKLRRRTLRVMPGGGPELQRYRMFHKPRAFTLCGDVYMKIITNLIMFFGFSSFK